MDKKYFLIANYQISPNRSRLKVPVALRDHVDNAESEFSFTLKVPESVISNMDPMSGFLANTFGAQLWVEAKLDMESAFDISKRIRVSIKQ